MKIFPLLLFVLAGIFIPTSVAHGDHDHGGHEHKVEWTALDSTLPKALSDLTATLDKKSGKAYIAGGCDSPLGNEYMADLGVFVCNSISDSLYEFNVATKTFSTLESMPRERYRHAAALVNDKLWLVGGRTLEDALIPQVDVYDIASNTWSTVGSLDENYQTSDHGAFAVGQYIYIVGGYNANYTAHDQVYRIDTTSSGDSLAIETRSPLDQPRGDVTAVYDETNNVAYISGGFSHTNDFCQPLASVEQYNVDQDDWTTIAPLQTPRAEKVLVQMGTRIFAVGGETHVENFCTSENDHDPGEQTVAVDTVEVFEGGDEWQVLWSLPQHKFRFAAIAWEPTFTIYTFGGQAAFDSDCQCFPTTNEVIMYVEDESNESTFGAGSSSNETSSAAGLSSFGGVILLAVMLIMA